MFSKQIYMKSSLILDITSLLWLLHYKNSFLDKNKILKFSFSLGQRYTSLSLSPLIQTSHIPLDLYGLQKPHINNDIHLVDGDWCYFTNVSIWPNIAVFYVHQKNIALFYKWMALIFWIFFKTYNPICKHSKVIKSFVAMFKIRLQFQFLGE